MNQIPQYTCHENAILWIFVISKKVIFLRWPLSKTRAGWNETPLNLRSIYQSKTSSLTSSILGISVAPKYQAGTLLGVFLYPGMKLHHRLAVGWTCEKIEDSCFEKEAFNALEASATLACLTT